MRLLLDKNIHGAILPLLVSAGHSVTAVGDEYPPRLDDREILAIGLAEGRVIITNDLDFGELTIRTGLPHAGVVLLRLPAQSPERQAERLLAVLQSHAGAFPALIVVAENSVRVRL